MTKDKIKLFIIDHDPIFRLGLRTAIAQYDNFLVLGEGNISNDTWRELNQGIILNVLVIGISTQSSALEIASLEFCHQLRQLYPQLPLFVLTPSYNSRQLAKLKSWGVEGYCDRGSYIATVIEGLQSLAYGIPYWQTKTIQPTPLQKFLANISQGGRWQLEATLKGIDAQLTNPNLSDWERAFLFGRKRELLTARWISRRLVAQEIEIGEEIQAIQAASLGQLVPIEATEITPIPIFADSANKIVFERVATDIQLGLINRTNLTLEIDILQPQAQKYLCQLILQRISETVEQIPIASSLDNNYFDYLKAVWSWTLNAFLTQYYSQLTIEEEQQLNIVKERDLIIIKHNIFDYIYGSGQLLEYLLGKPSFIVDQVVYQSDDPEVIARIEFLLHNLILNLANSVVQIILNNFYTLEVLKYKLYKSEYRSDRELARFRNQLSWKYRQEKYFSHPQNIFESRHSLLVLSSGTIRTMFISAPRRQELEQLNGIPWLTTIVIEVRDAIAPLVRQFIALAGSAVVFVLTQVIGKGLGLVAKGIIQGIGSTIKDLNQKK
ncbi:response regulator receiver protein [Chondrocystis sp. NIES-4102]|nr:response regulator receiver protein [Chondrocystis sp. NIES-4102]